MGIKETIQTVRFSGRARSWLYAVLAVCTLALHFDAFREWVEGAKWGYSMLREKGFAHASYKLNVIHEMADEHLSPGTSVHILTREEKQKGSALRFSHLMLFWHQCPAPVRYGPKEQIGKALAVYAPRFAFKPEPDENGIPRYDCVYGEYGWSLWVHPESSRPDAADLAGRRVSVVHEITGLVCVLLPAIAGLFLWKEWTGMLVAHLLLTIGTGLLLLAGVPIRAWSLAMLVFSIFLFLFWIRFVRRRNQASSKPVHLSVRLSAFVFLYVGFLAWLCLSHDFTAPNGLGVFGGRAALFYRLGGIPRDLFTDSAYRFLEPAYPPGLAMLLLSMFGFSGGCAERLPQLLSVFAMGVLLYRLLLHASGSIGKQCLVSAFFLCPTTLAIATNCYAEPFMALCLLAGWEAVRNGSDDWSGWFFAGAAGWFKNEGALFFLFLWLSMRICRGKKSASFRGLVLGALLPAIWFFGSRISGARLFDYAPIWTPDLQKCLLAGKAMAGEMFARPWETAFFYPLLATGYFMRLVGARTRLTSSDSVFLCFIAFCLLSFAGIYGLSTADDFSWHLHSSLDRLLWLPAVLGWCFLWNTGNPQSSGAFPVEQRTVCRPPA